MYARLRPREMELGFTLFGPHRDDLHILLNHKEARLFASEGQQRSSVAAMRLAEWERLAQAEAEQPLMLLDDVGMSLDSMRSAHLMKLLQQMPGQRFLTSTAPLALEGHILELFK